MWTGCSAMGAANKKEALWQKKKETGLNLTSCLAAKLFSKADTFLALREMKHRCTCLCLCLV